MHCKLNCPLIFTPHNISLKMVPSNSPLYSIEYFRWQFEFHLLTAVIEDTTSININLVIHDDSMNQNEN